VLAGRAANFERAIRDMERVWASFHARQVYRSDTWTMLKTSLHWLAALVFGGLGVRNPVSLLDDTPLRALLERDVRFGSIARAIERGHLEALAVTASGYSSARSVTWFQGRPNLTGWTRVRRIGRAQKITIDHLMASAAVPFVFPPVKIGGEYFGDGSMRHRAPLSPAIHLGAERMLVIGVRDERPDPEPPANTEALPADVRTARRLYARHAIHGRSLYRPRARVELEQDHRDGRHRAGQGHRRPLAAAAHARDRAEGRRALGCRAPCA
jgi:NTE family protein